MRIAAINLNGRDYHSEGALLARLKAELTMLRRLRISCVKLYHGSVEDGGSAETRTSCRQYLHEQLADGAIRALCIGEHFGPFEADGCQVAKLCPELRQDSDWSRQNDAITIILI